MTLKEKWRKENNWVEGISCQGSFLLKVECSFCLEINRKGSFWKEMETRQRKETYNGSWREISIKLMKSVLLHWVIDFVWNLFFSNHLFNVFLLSTCLILWLSLNLMKDSLTELSNWIYAEKWIERKINCCK